VGSVRGTYQYRFQDLLSLCMDWKCDSWVSYGVSVVVLGSSSSRSLGGLRPFLVRSDDQGVRGIVGYLSDAAIAVSGRIRKSGFRSREVDERDW
jgi:hypothetical protein